MESCRDSCTIFALARAHVACEPLIRELITQRALELMDSHSEAANELGPITADAINVGEQRISALSSRLEQTMRICSGPSISSDGGKMIMECSGFDAKDLEQILANQKQLEEILSQENS